MSNLLPHLTERQNIIEEKNKIKNEKIKIILLPYHHHLDQQEQLLNQASVLMLYPAFEPGVIDRVTRLAFSEVLHA